MQRASYGRMPHTPPGKLSLEAIYIIAPRQEHCQHWHMSEQAKHREHLVGLLGRYINARDEAPLREYLLQQSGLPGPRANLELAAAFAEVVAHCASQDPRDLWALCLRWATIPPTEGATDDPREFLPFCATQALGALGSANPALHAEALARLRELADAPGWRTREAVAMAIQRLIAGQPQKTLVALDGWIAPGHWLAMRAVAAGVAEPALLRHKKDILWILKENLRAASQRITLPK